MKTEWDYTHLYASMKEWKIDKEKVVNKLETLRNNVSKCCDSKEDFLFVLKMKFEIEEMIERLYCYGKRHVDQDSSNSSMTKVYQDAWQLYLQLLNLQTILENKILEHGETIKNWFHNTDIAYYQTYIETILRKKQHIIKEEDTNALQGSIKQKKMIQKLYRSLTEEDIQFGTFIDHEKKERKATAKVTNQFSKSKIAEERKDSFSAHMKGYQGINGTMSTLLDMKLESEIEIAKIKNYDTVLEMRLKEEMIPEDTANKLIETVNKNLSLVEKYNKLKKEILNLKEYHYYDRNLEIQDTVPKKYSLKEAINIIKQGVAILGEQAISYIDQAFQEGWVDVYEKEHKRKDSFTCISYVGVPYVSLNYHNRLIDVKTLAHELGHMIHTAYAKDHQPFEYFEYSLFLAEIASKVNELLVEDYLVENSNLKEEQLYLLDSSMKSMINSLFHQTMITEFEQLLIEEKMKNGTLSSKFINQTYLELVKKYNGNVMEEDDEVCYAWEQYPHFYTQDNFYVWQYATGVCIAGSIVHKLKTEEGFKEKYVKFLSAGKSLSIVDSLKLIDIDLKEGNYIENTIKVLEEKYHSLVKVLK